MRQTEITFIVADATCRFTQARAENLRAKGFKVNVVESHSILPSGVMVDSFYCDELPKKLSKPVAGNPFLSTRAGHYGAKKK